MPLDDALVVFDNSNGGVLDAALQIGKAIRLKEFDTSVAANAECASACAYTWLAGKRRYMEPNAKVGFHAAYQIDAEGKPKTSGSANALIGAYLGDLGLSSEAMIYITDPGPEEMRWLTLDQANEIGIVAQAAQVTTAMTDPEQHEPEDESEEDLPLPKKDLSPGFDMPKPELDAPKTDPSTESQYVEKVGVDIEGPISWNGQSINAEHCKRQCMANDEMCKAYSFHTQTKKCTLHTAAQFSFRNAQGYLWYHNCQS